ncbi:hypothetical protein [Geomonas ferrireducens]|uniref:hypothetical protein n=1 Tax=Geomonas ferrireducens TaxID=2570227 RepID=UPI0010A833C5|nr:hypothetical protein [Geomonas ferrireducens]
MLTAQQKLKLLAVVYRSMGDSKWGPRTVAGYLPPLTPNVLTQLSELEAAGLTESVHLDDRSILVSDINLDLHSGKTFHIELNTSNGPTIPFVRTFQELLDLPTALTKKPIAFFVEDINYCSEDDGAPPQIVSKYLSILSFVQTLQRLSDFADMSSSGVLTLVFLLKEKYEVRVEYGAADVEKASQSETLLHFLESTPHEANKRDILKGVVVDTIKSSRTPFTSLISSLDDVTRRATDNYAVFVSEFSFDKIRDEIEKRKSEFILRINKVFSDIQDKLLGVPLALIIASTQLDTKGDYGKNTSIICGISIFTILMALLLKNQVANLEAIKEEYAYQEGLLEKEYSSLHAKIEKAFKVIQGRWLYLDRKLQFVAGLVLGNYAFACFLYYQWTPQFRDTFDAICYLSKHYFLWGWALIR